MLNYDNFAITLGRAIEAFRVRPDAVEEHKAALRALVALTRLGGATLALVNGRLVMSGKWIAPTLPGIATLVEQMDTHDVREIRIERGAAAAALLELLRGLSGGLGTPGDGRGLEERLRDSRVAGVSVRATPPPAPSAPTPPAPAAAAAPGAVVAAPDEATRGAAPGSLAAMITDLALDPHRADVLDRAAEAAELVRAELEGGRPSTALSAAAELVRLEGRLSEGGPRRSLAIVLNRLLSRPLLQTAVEHARGQERDEQAARLLLRRGGGDATEVLLERLVQAPTIGERRRCFDLLKAVADGLRQMILMLGHPDWFVVRNVAELLGELRATEAVAPLARTLRHPDTRVRRAAAQALARIGSPDTLEHLASLLSDPDPDLRAAVAAAIGGREMERLTMALVVALDRERDRRVTLELCRALGRLRTAPAVETLVRGTAPPGWRWWRRRPGRRLAAVEGLQLAGGAMAVGALERLLRDRDREVRRAAREALEDLDVL